MRGKIAKKIEMLVPDFVVPKYILDEPDKDIRDIRKRKYKKMLYKNLNWIKKTKLTVALGLSQKCSLGLHRIS